MVARAVQFFMFLLVAVPGFPQERVACSKLFDLMKSELADAVKELRENGAPVRAFMNVELKRAILVLPMSEEDSEHPARAQAYMEFLKWCPVRRVDVREVPRYRFRCLRPNKTQKAMLEGLQSSPKPEFHPILKAQEQVSAIPALERQLVERFLKKASANPWAARDELAAYLDQKQNSGTSIEALLNKERMLRILDHRVREPTAPYKEAVEAAGDPFLPGPENRVWGESYKMTRAERIAVLLETLRMKDVFLAGAGVSGSVYGLAYFIDNIATSEWKKTKRVVFWTESVSMLILAVMLAPRISLPSVFAVLRWRHQPPRDQAGATDLLLDLQHTDGVTAVFLNEEEASSKRMEKNAKTIVGSGFHEVDWECEVVEEASK